MIVAALISAVLSVAPIQAPVAAAAPQPSAAAPSGSAAPPDGTYTYSIQQTGSDLGKSTVKIARADIGITVHEEQQLQSSYTFIVDEIFDPATLSPRAFTGVYTRDTSSSTVRVAVDGGGATVTIDGTPGTASFPNPPGVKQTYLIEGTLMSGFAMLPAEIHASKATQFSLVAPRSVLQAVCSVDPHPIVTRPPSVPANDDVLSVTGKVNFDAWYDPQTFVVHAVSVPSQQVLIILTK